MRITDNFVFFWDGVFSQWHSARFEVVGTQYSCAEQYMMRQKALLFADTDMADAIMRARSPKQQKALGRKVRGFKATAWDAVARDVVFTGNMAKFGQNESLLHELLSTNERTLVEASPYDLVWGVGLSAGDERILDPRQWKGKNWLGEVLMKVREQLIR